MRRPNIMLTKAGKVDKRTKIGRILFYRLEEIQDELKDLEKSRAKKDKVKSSKDSQDTKKVISSNSTKK